MKSRFRWSTGDDAVLPLTRAMVRRGVLLARHLETATTPADALRTALEDIVGSASGESEDQFGIELGITDALDEYRKPEERVLFFVWNNAGDPQYIPLRPIYEHLEGNPHRDSLMASVYNWLYHAASRIFDAFGIADAERIYQWRREAYLSEREAGEDVDLEGEVEAANPAQVVPYIRQCCQLKLRKGEIEEAIRSIIDPTLREAFRRAHSIYLTSRRIHLPVMSTQYQQFVEDAAYYMDASPLPGIGISHWRDDPIVAWLDEHCRDQFESGVSSRAPIILCFRPDDTEFFTAIVNALPAMARTIAGLSDWVRFAEGMEDASNYRDREDA